MSPRCVCGKQRGFRWLPSGSWALFFALALSACQHGRAEPKTTANPSLVRQRPTGGVAPRAPSMDAIDTDSSRLVRTAEDVRIVPAARREIEQIPGVAQHRVSLQSRTGVVTVAGEVEDAAAVAAVVQAIERIRDVRAIVNRLEVVPNTATDAQIQQNVENAIKFDVVTQAQDLRATVKDGVVALEGSVRTIPEREIAEDAALAVPGVRAVDNKLVLTLVESVADDVLAQRISRRLSNDARLLGSQIQVNVGNSRVTLSGAVGSAFERRVARANAWMAGVRNVDDAALAVRRSVDHLRANEPKLSDAEVQSAVEDAIAFDARIPPRAVTVKTEGGVVRLEGSVPNEAAKRAAQENALNTVGAREVDDRIAVEPPVAVADYLVESSVTQRLREHPGITIDELTVAVERGNVTLRGAASNNYEKLRAEMAASRVPGVLGVKNELSIAAPAAATRTDAQLRRDILSELRWDPRVDASRVKVDVENGVATISGEVPDWETYNAVLENVFEVSPKRVENRLERTPARPVDREFSFTAPE